MTGMTARRQKRESEKYAKSRSYDPTRVQKSRLNKKLEDNKKLHFKYMVINLFSIIFLLSNWFCENR